MVTGGIGEMFVRSDKERLTCIRHGFAHVAISVRKAGLERVDKQTNGTRLRKETSTLKERRTQYERELLHREADHMLHTRLRDVPACLPACLPAV